MIIAMVEPHDFLPLTANTDIVSLPETNAELAGLSLAS
jgi:hypothetical protein